MSEISLIFYMVFGGNLLLDWGLPGYLPNKTASNLQNAIMLVVVTIVSTLINGLVYRYVLMPLGLETLVPIVFTLLLFSINALLNLLARLKSKTVLSFSDSSDLIMPFSLVLYAAAMANAPILVSPFLMIVGGLVAALGYLAASILIEDIVERLKLEPVPAAFEGSPIRFMSAGLIALVFTGIEAAFLIKLP